MYLLVWCFIIFVSVISITGYTGDAMLGPTDLIFQSMETCDQEGIINFSIKQKRYNRTAYVLDINIDVPYDIDDNVMLELKGSLKKEGGYKPGSFYMKDKACDTLQVLLGDLFTDILQAAGTENCPLPAGEHAALDYYFDNEKFTVPQLYGEYMMEVFIYKDEVQDGCSVIYYKLMPKED